MSSSRRQQDDDDDDDFEMEEEDALALQDDDDDDDDNKPLPPPPSSSSAFAEPTTTRRSGRVRTVAHYTSTGDDDDDDGNDNGRNDNDDDDDDDDDDNDNRRRAAAHRKKTSTSPAPPLLPPTTTTGGGGLEMESILHVAWKPRAEWRRIMTQTNTSKVTLGSRLGDVPAEEDDPEERFLIKWKDASRLHSTWETGQELVRQLHVQHVASRIDPRLRKARLVPPASNHYARDGGFNPEFVRIDRVLDVSGEDGTSQALVKWSMLGYDEATWEEVRDLPADAYAAALAALRRRQQRAVALGKLSPAQINAKLNQRVVLPMLSESPAFGTEHSPRRLRAYQLEALNWLSFNWMQSRSSILADEMGLGKTACSVAFASAVCQASEGGPVLVVAPLPVLPHFAREFAAWAPHLNVVVLRGNPKSRQLCKQYEFFTSTSPAQYKFDVVLTNYETVLEEEPALTQCPWALVVVDEGHRLKNRTSKLTQLMRDRMDRRSTLLLTGTPIQNDTGELWTLLNFIAPEAFPSQDAFVSKYGSMKTAQQMDDFHCMLKPFLLRRFKTDVEANLPPKDEIIIEVELTQLQKYYYRSVYEQNVQQLVKGVSPGTRVNLNNVAMQLRKVCNHPYLIDGVEAKSLADHGITSLMMDDQAMQLLIQASGKFTLLDKLLPKLQRDGHRVLVFSQFVRVLDVLEDYLRYRQYGYERIDGSVNGMRRQEAIDRFSAPEATSLVFLLSTRGCGQGINLTAADTVVLFDSDWNPQNDVQAQARAHRIGQTKPVSIYRLVTRKTYEQEMFNRASLKLGLDEAMTSKLLKDQLANANSNGGELDADEAKLGAGVSDAELEHMLKFGAYALGGDGDGGGEDGESRAFCEADIDTILSKRSTRVSTAGGQAAASSSSSKFSKATFVSNSAGEVTDMDDPDFWSKLLGKDVAQLNQTTTETDGGMGKGRRSRRQVNYSEDGKSAAAAAAAAAAALSSDDEDAGAGDETATPSRPAVLSMTSAKNLITGLTTYAFGRYGEIAKKVGVQMKEDDCARYGLGIALVCCVWRSQEDRSGGFPFPLSDSEEDVTNACKSLAGILTRDPASPLLADYRGPLRRSLLDRLARELGKYPFEVAKSMLMLPRLKERCKDTVGQLADVVDVDNYCTGATTQIGQFTRGVPPALAWVSQDDVALVKSFYKWGFERRRKAESWKQVFGDEACGWTRPWQLPANLGAAGEGAVDGVEEPAVVDAAGAPVADDMLSMKRLSSRLNRIITSLTEPQPADKASAPSSPGGEEGGARKAKSSGSASAGGGGGGGNSTVMTEATRLRKKQEAEQGDVVTEWNATEKERLTQLIMRYGVPDAELYDQGDLLSLGGSAPAWDVFQSMLPRKTLEAIQQRVNDLLVAYREMDNCPPSKKGLLNRADLLASMWRCLLEDVSSREELELLLGCHFKGVQRHQKQMPAWWTPSLDVSLLRAVCRYGMGAWQSEALLDDELFPQELPSSASGDTSAYPVAKDLNLRFVAVVDWLVANAKKPLPIEGEDKHRLRGEMLMCAPTMRMLEDQLKKSAASSAGGSAAGAKKKTDKKTPPPPKKAAASEGGPKAKRPHLEEEQPHQQEFEDDPIENDDDDDDDWPEREEEEEGDVFEDE